MSWFLLVYMDLCLTLCPPDTGCKLNIQMTQKTSMASSERLMCVQFTSCVCYVCLHRISIKITVATNQESDHGDDDELYLWNRLPFFFSIYLITWNQRDNVRGNQNCFHLHSNSVEWRFMAMLSLKHSDTYSYSNY